MVGRVPEYDDDHPPPQWSRLYRPDGEVPGDNPLDPAAIPGALGLDAPNQDLDHLGKIGIKVSADFSEQVNPDAFHTMSEFTAEKHIYIVQFLWGWPERITVDGFDLEYWDAWISMMTRIRETMVRDFNTFVYIHFVIYPVMLFSPSDFSGEGPGSPYFRWKTWSFVPEARIDTALDLPSWCSVQDQITDRNLNAQDIGAGIAAAILLGGPGLGAGRTGVGIVNSYPTFNVAENIGLYASVNPGTSPTFVRFVEGNMLQTFVQDRIAAFQSFDGQTDIEQADTKPAIVDFSARGSGVDETLLAIDSEFYEQQNTQTGSFDNFRPFGSPHNDFHGNGPNHPGFFPYPHPGVNLFFYFCENDAGGGYKGRNNAGWMAGSTVRYFAREGFVEDVNVEMQDSDPELLKDITRICNYDGVMGEISTYVGSGALSGNAGTHHPALHHHPMGIDVKKDIYVGDGDFERPLNWIANTFDSPELNEHVGFITMTRDSCHAAILAAQVIWTDHMGAPAFDVSMPPVKNLAVLSTNTNVDFDQHNRENNPTQFPPHEGIVDRPYAELFWNGGLERLSGSLDSPMYANLTNGMQVAADNVTAGFPDWTRVNVFNLGVVMWEVRWALDAQTLLDGGGTRVNWLRQTTSNQFSDIIGQRVEWVASKCWIPVSHGRDEPTLIFFTAVSWAIMDGWDRNTLVGNSGRGNFPQGKMILKPMNPNRQFSPGSLSFPLPNINPTPYPRSLLDNRFRRDNDFTNVKDPYPEEMVVTSALLPADPEVL